MFWYGISGIEKPLLGSEDDNEKDRIVPKSKAKLLGVFLSFGAVSLLLITNSTISGMKLDFVDVMFVQGLGEVIIFPLIIYKKNGYFWIWNADQNKNVNHMRWILVFGAMVGSIKRLTHLVSITFMPLGDAMAIVLSNAIPTTILATIFFKERFRMIKLICLILVVTGIVLVIRPPFVFHDDLNINVDDIGATANTTSSFHNNKTSVRGKYYYIGAISAVGCAIFRSIQSIASKYLVQNNSNCSAELIILYLGIAHLIVSLLLPFTFNGHQRIIYSDESTKDYSLSQWLGLFGSGMLLYGIQWMHFNALTLVSPVIVAFVRSTEILLSYIVQTLFFKTIPNVSAIVGACNVIIACVVIVSEGTILEILPNNVKYIF